MRPSKRNQGDRGVLFSQHGVPLCIPRSQAAILTQTSHSRAWRCYPLFYYFLFASPVAPPGARLEHPSAADGIRIGVFIFYLLMSCADLPFTTTLVARSTTGLDG